MHQSDFATLVLVAKRPRLGVGKQRIAASMGGDAALLIAQALWDCALEDAQQWQGPVVFALPNDDFSADYPFPVIAQGEGNLGERLNYIDEHLRAQGHQQLVYIGMDCPLLTPHDYQSVCHALQSADCVFSPADDGGVVLMATRSAWPDLSALAWSSAELGAQLMALCQQHDYRIAQTKAHYDIDTKQDLIRLLPDLALDSRPARQRLHQLITHLLSTADRD